MDAREFVYLALFRLNQKFTANTTLYWFSYSQKSSECASVVAKTVKDANNAQKGLDEDHRLN